MTSHNPFAPPEAATVDLAPVIANPSHKPLSAWLVQIFGMLLGLFMLWGLVTMTFQGAVYRGPNGVRSIYLVDLGWRLLVFVDLWYAITGIGLRSRAGRWAGLVFIGFVFVVVAIGLVGAVLAASRWHAGNAHSTVAVGGAVALGCGLLVLALIGFWFHAFGFSARARAYFRVGATPVHRP